MKWFRNFAAQIALSTLAIVPATALAGTPTPPKVSAISIDGTGLEVGTVALTPVTLTAASANGNSADQISHEAHGIVLVVNITAITGTSPTLTVTIQGKDAASGQYYTILASTALTTTGTTVLRVFPALTASANATANDVLPPTWRVLYAIGGTTPAVTATVGANLIP